MKTPFFTEEYCTEIKFHPVSKLPVVYLLTVEKANAKILPLVDELRSLRSNNNLLEALVKEQNEGIEWRNKEIERLRAENESLKEELINARIDVALGEK